MKTPISWRCKPDVVGPTLMVRYGTRNELLESSRRWIATEGSPTWTIERYAKGVRVSTGGDSTGIIDGPVVGLFHERCETAYNRFQFVVHLPSCRFIHFEFWWHNIRGAFRGGTEG